MWTLLLAAAHATEPVNPFQEVDESELFRFDERIVTIASRYAQTLRKAPSIVTLLTEDDIRAGGFRNISELLRTLPGIYLWKSPEGRDLAAFRGVVSPDNNKVLVLLDGVPFYDALYTHSMLGDMVPISALKQVEVIKGPGSAIYGTNAFTGVINLITHDGRDLEGARVRLLAGSGNRWDLTATAGGRQIVAGRELVSNAYARVFSLEGFGIDVSPRGRRNVWGTDPRRGLNVGGRFAIDGLQVSAHHQDGRQRFRQAAEFTDPVEGIGMDLDSFGLAYSNTLIDARWSIERGPVTLTPFANVQWHDHPGGYFFYRGFDSTDPADIQQLYSLVETEKFTRRLAFGVDVEARPGIDHRLVAGAGLESLTATRVLDARYDDGANFPVLHDNFALYDSCGTPAGFGQLRLQLDDYPEGPCRSPTLHNAYAYAQYTWTATPSVELTGGARLDNRFAPVNTAPPDGFGLGGQLADARFASLSPRAGVLLVPTDTLTAKFLYGRAFRAPTARELLVVSAFDEDAGRYPSTTGNFQLRPEVIHTAEAELSVDLDSGFSARIDGYYSALDQEIDKVEPGLYCNLPGALSVIGAEAEVAARVGILQADVGYALTLARYGGNQEADNNCQDGDRNDFAGGLNPYAGRRQYEFPPHMVKGRVALRLSDRMRLTGLGELYSARPRREWLSPDELDIPAADGPAFGLVHAAFSARDLGPTGAIGLTIALRNVLDTRIGTGQYRDDVGEVGVDYRGRTQPLYSDGYVMEGRSLTVGVEFEL